VKLTNHSLYKSISKQVDIAADEIQNIITTYEQGDR